VDSAVAALERNAFGFEAYPSATIASQTFLVLSRFHRAIAVITIVASAVFPLCIMLLKVKERRADAAVIRFVGVRRRTIFGALPLEGAVIAVVGSGVGTVLAVVASAATNAYYRHYFETALAFAHSALRITAFGFPVILLLPRAPGHDVPAPGGLST
jgi:putative ABC transport system permease protein